MRKSSFFLPAIIAAVVNLVVVVIAAVFIVGAVKDGISSGWSNNEWVSIAIAVVAAIGVAGIASITAFAVNASQMRRGF